MEKQKVCLTIAGLDPSGGAGIIADIKAFRAFGCFATAAITSITFQNTQGVFGAVHQTAETVRKQILPILEDFEVASVKTGMLPTREIIEEVAEIISKNNIKNFIVDPVVRSTSGYDLIDDESLKALIDKLFPLASIVTPNIPETERICGMKIQRLEDFDKAALKIVSMGAKAVLIKGGHLYFEKIERSLKPIYISPKARRSARKAVDLLFFDGERKAFVAEYIETKATHGTGCTLASAIAAGLALGKNLQEAVFEAKKFVTNAILTSPNIGKGFPPINV
ncbi:MAG: bifunctional hydroxymethylpyrimidine kinase/phosphomethylpyrimidine kinase [Acidobacteria bacterium]|jgi:hydroxymethylpyrimidine kinase/phosphomethylpyrimidine kinase|nr:MAG: bifunctional hydroxymethylpyrimidine kinase/phosphomethylpyrimidine kinase [Acidobacteriota bacterium]GIU82307.1 MAG: hydroxymethylpyrimidine/phosphomethylpyrimidine kinase [Pyrinomonadaceae bacterium]